MKSGSAMPWRAGFVALIAVLSSCAPDTRLGVLDAQYQAPEVPVHFRTARDGISLSLSASMNSQNPLFHQRLYRERTDGKNLYLTQDPSDPHPYGEIEERYRLARERYAMTGAITWQQDALYSGLTAGAAPASRGEWNAGAFFGFSGGPGPWMFTAGGGLFRNRIRRSARFWSYFDAPYLDSLSASASDSVYTPDSVSGVYTDWEIRFAVGAMYRAHARLAPYLIAEGGTTRVWAKPRQGADYAHVEDASVGIGLECRPGTGWPMRIEIRSGQTRTVEGWGNAFLQGGMRLTREL
ncbi:MAG: hypothetical protein JF616_21190 [Fibrobacteres bacterium]|jgi:hypothetical protein|nr:hypothetical protein [Fibrobacterota bacterium]